VLFYFTIWQYLLLCIYIWKYVYTGIQDSEGVGGGDFEFLNFTLLNDTDLHEYISRGINMYMHIHVQRSDDENKSSLYIRINIYMWISI
jgi:hypothetical protein